MGAEKWLNFVEVKDYALQSYLVMMRAKGYAIVGAEQTACSKPLNKVQFPKKMLLVLGYFIRLLLRAVQRFISFSLQTRKERNPS